MSKITEYNLVTELGVTDLFLIDGPDGTRIIAVGNALNSLAEMFDITEYDAATELSSDDVFLIGGATGNKKITVPDVANGLASLLPDPEYTTVATLSDNDKILVDGSKAITAQNASKSLAGLLSNDAFFTMLDTIGSPILHRQIYRGKNLGTSFTSAQKAAIANGTFEDIWLGDYWDIGVDIAHTYTVVRFVVADFDYWYGTGDIPFEQHHIVVIPETSMYNAKMDEISANTLDYYHTAMRGGDSGVVSGNLADAYTAFYTAFGSSLLTHREYLCDDVDVTDNYFETGSWHPSTVDLPNELMIFGNHQRLSRIDNSRLPFIRTNSKVQLALMAASPKFIAVNNDGYWFRDYCGSTDYLAINTTGIVGRNQMFNPTGVRPVAAIGGPAV